MEYNGELTFSGLIKVFKHDCLRWIICVAAAFIITFAITFTIYNLKTTYDYIGAFAYSIDPTNPEQEMSKIKSEENVYAALKAEGYSDEEISSKSLTQKVISCLYVSPQSFTREYITDSQNTETSVYYYYSVSLEEPDIEGFTDSQYISLVNAIINNYTSSYGIDRSYTVPSAVSSFDTSSLEYIAAADYMYSKASAIYKYIEEGISGDYLTSYIDEKTGYSFYDMRNMFSEVLNEIELYRLYVKNNAAISGGKDLSAKEYIEGRLSYYESLYSEKKFEYDTLTEMFKQAAAGTGFTTTTTSTNREDGSVKTVVESSFNTVFEQIRAVAQEVASAKNEVLKWREVWTSYGGTIEYDADGSASYNGDGFAGNTSAEAGKKIEEVENNLKALLEIYGDFAERYNQSFRNDNYAYFYYYAFKKVWRNMSTSLLVVINVAVVALVFAAVNLHSYRVLKKKGEFDIEENAQ